MPADPPPLRWFLRRYGANEEKVDYTFEDLGIAGATQELVNQGVDTCTLRFAGLRPAGVDLLVAGGWATVFGGSLAWFSGRVAPPQRGADGRSERSALVLRGPWYDLGRHVYMAPGAYIVNPPQAGADGVIASLPFAPVKGSAISSNLLLAKDQNGTLIDGMQVVRRALAYGLKAGAWFQLGSLPATLPIPAEAIRDRTVADVLRSCVRWSPSLAVFFDHRTLPPTLHMVPRADLPAVSFAAGDEGTVANVAVSARPDQVIPGVCVQYVRQFTQQPQIQIDATAAAPVVVVAPVKARPVVDLTGTFVPSNGPGINSGDSHFVPSTSDPGSGGFGTGASFVRGPDGLQSVNGSGGFRRYTPNFVNGQLVDNVGYLAAPPPAATDPAPAAPTVPPASVSQAPAFMFSSIEYEVAGLPFLATGEIVAKLGALVLTVELATSLTGKEITPKTSPSVRFSPVRAPCGVSGTRTPAPRATPAAPAAPTTARCRWGRPGSSPRWPPRTAPASTTPSP